MKKKDLKSKMIVALRDGSFYLVVDDVIVKENCYNLLSHYSENLLSIDRKDLDIVEIFEFVNKSYKFTNDLGMGALRFSNIVDNGNVKSIWKRVASYDGGDLIDGEKVWIVSKIGGLSVVYNFDYEHYNEEYKYFSSEFYTLKYLEVLNSVTFSFNDYVKMSEKEFEEHCEKVIKEEFLKHLKDVEL